MPSFEILGSSKKSKLRAMAVHRRHNQTHALSGYSEATPKTEPVAEPPPEEEPNV